jgi:hypothetical protein
MKFKKSVQLFIYATIIKYLYLIIFARGGVSLAKEQAKALVTVEGAECEFLYDFRLRQKSYELLRGYALIRAG